MRLKGLSNTLLILSLLLWNAQAAAALTIEITQTVDAGVPVAVVPFGWVGGGAGLEQDVAAVVRADLDRSGRFKNLPVRKMVAFPQTGSEIDFDAWRRLNLDHLVVGQIRPLGADRYQIRFQLFDVVRKEQLAGYKMNTTARDLRTTAHRIADIIFEKLTGHRGAFATRVAYITSIKQPGGGREIALNVADADGFNAQTIVSSPEPLMSPSWSPDGQRLAYVSFEGGKPGIYVQDIYSGKRQQVASFPGINGAPAWSPDGRRLALTLSKDGDPDIYVLDLQTGQLRQLTDHYAIDTEPAWSPDGRWIAFTSDRGGGPQIYRIPSAGGEPERLSFKGGYNARPSFSPRGDAITMVSRVGKQFRIGLLNLRTKAIRILTEGALDESPSFAPNGSMIIYATKVNGKGELAAVSVDGRIRQRLAMQVGDVREPIWSPYSKAQ